MRTLLRYIDAVNARDYASMASVFDDALEHRILPKSMARPVLTKKQYLDYSKSLLGMFAKFETKIHEVIEAGDKLTVHGSTRGKSWSGTPYTNEYMLLIHFTHPTPSTLSPSSSSGGGGGGESLEDEFSAITFGRSDADRLPKIRLLKEFVDSSVTLQFFRDESERKRKREEEERQRRGSLLTASSPKAQLLRGRTRGLSVNGNGSGAGCQY